MVAGNGLYVELSGCLLDSSEYAVANELGRELERMRVFEFGFKYNSAPWETRPSTPVDMRAKSNGWYVGVSSPRNALKRGGLDCDGETD